MFVTCIVIIASTIAIFIFLGNVLNAKAIQTSQARIDADLAVDEIARLKKLHSYLEDNKQRIDKTASIVAESQKYMYQDQVITDVTAYASQYGIGIAGFEFEKAKSSSNTTTKPTEDAGPRRATINLQLSDNIPYDNFYRLLLAIERNVTKMQITGISLQPQLGSDAVQASAITLEVFIK